MGYLAQTAADIAQIIENIDFVANKNTLTFHSEEKIINTLADTRSIIGNVDIMILLNEIWDKTSYPDRVSQAEFLLSEKFKSLLNWKKEINDIVVLRDALKNDCTSFFNNCRSIGNTMTSTGFDNLIIFYEQIGFRLLKLRRDCKELMEKIKQKAEEEEESKKNPLHGNYNKFILNPDKTSQFAAELSKLYKECFFLAVSEDTEIREEDIYFGFQKFFGIELLPVDASNTDMIIEKSLSGIPTVINSEFGQFLLHSNKNLLANKIRETFTTEKGKAISLLLYALESNNPPLITIGNRQLKSIYRALQALFNRDIGTYQSINYKYIEESDKPDLDSIRLKLNHILTELDKEQLA